MVLGAACGEAVLGKKIGNKALIWGAVGGTIPDLDVMSNAFMDGLEALLFHRGPMHSLLFASLAPFPLAWLVMKFYDAGWYNLKSYRRTGFVSAIVLFLLVGFALQTAFLLFAGKLAFALLPLILLSLFLIIRRLRSDYLMRDQEFPEASYRDWVLLFFFSIFTHPILDAFTTFGTQLYWPFSHTRVSLSTISIADPIYTLPFLFSVVLSGFYHRGDRRRRIAVWTGLAVSTLYISATCFTKMKVNEVFRESLKKENASASHMITVPTIFNNLLWYGIARQDSSYYCGYYSILDPTPEVRNFMQVPKGRALDGSEQGKQMAQKLEWFSDGFCNVIPRADDTLQWNDLRFGSLNFRFEKPEDFVFHFDLLQKNDSLLFLPERKRPDATEGQMQRFWQRAFGKVE